MSFATDEHSLLCSAYGPAPSAIHELTPPVSDFGFWRDRMGDRRGEVVFGLIGRDGRMVLTRSADYPPGVFRVPSGGIRHGESAVDALHREVAEELGLDFDVWRYAGRVEFRFAGDSGVVALPSYCFLLREADTGAHTVREPRTFAGPDVAGEIESCQLVSAGELGPVLRTLAELPSPWDDSGRYRARTGQLLAATWQAALKDQQSHRVPCGLLDLSLPVGPGMPCYPGDEPPRRRLLRSRAEQGLPRASKSATAAGQPGWEVSEWSLSAHAGTHVDAPAHLIPGGKTVDQLRLESLVGPALVIDCRRAAAAGRQVEVRDLPQAGPLRGNVVLIKLGASLDVAAGRFEPDHVGLSAAAARYLAAAGILALGVDSLDVDSAASGHPAHAELLGAGVPIIEGLDLRAAGPGDGWLFAGQPLRLAGAEAAPCRAILWRSGAGPGFAAARSDIGGEESP
ncbi:MAG: cyclase family protein [Bacillota bacterium]|nr:cyclase family protein [Bacillota bacterium]